MIFDASALLAFLLAEPGSDKIASKLSDGLISSVNWSEIIGHFARNGVSQPDIQHVLGFLPIKQIIPFLGQGNVRS